MNDLDAVEALLDAARRHGADAADALLVHDHARSVLTRRGVAEGLEHAESLSLGLRVFLGRRSASVSGNVLSADMFEKLAEQACAMARLVPEDPFGGLAEQAQKGRFDAAGLELEDISVPPDMETLLARTRLAEDTALSVTGIMNSNGASAGYGRTTVALGTSDGFLGQYTRTRHALSISVVAGEGAAMQRDYTSHSTLHAADLDDPARLGKEAAERSLARLNPSKPRTGRYSVIYDPRVSSSLLGHFAAAISGASVARGTSFLRDRLGQSVFPAEIRITDDPRLKRGLASRPFDAEGCAVTALDLVTDGRLEDWLLDSRSARQLDRRSNARASRSVGGAPSPGVTNLFLHPGRCFAEELRSDIREGILVTELMGSSINMLTGDYSRGASGFMIRDGQLAEPVAELTIAGNLCDMFARLHHADDLTFRQSINAPSIRIDAMNVAGL